MAFKLTWKTILPLAVALIFLSSIFVVFSSRGTSGKNKVYITVDLGTPDHVYNGLVNAGENATALGVLSSYAGKVELKNGKINCVLNYCNSNHSVWKFYKVEEGAIGPQETEINETPENVFITGGDRLVFRFETI
jgi:hypothetical protein